MRWRNRRRSQHVEDRRGAPRMRRGIAGGGLGTIVVVLLALYFGVDPSLLLNMLEPGGGDMGSPAETRQLPPEQQELAEFVSVVLADTEDTWHALFRREGGVYREPALVLFTQAVRSACGYAQAAMGPFYCPADSKVYIDLSFYRELKDRFKAPGDFAQAYVVAHEVGHHVQNLLGISEQVHAARSRLSETEGNRLSVRQELQADCFAGVWAHHAQRVRDLLEAGDIEEGLNAAASIGDDRLQRQSTGVVVPESFTHGSSAQRVHWFRRGIESGAVADCNSFDSAEL